MKRTLIAIGLAAALAACATPIGGVSTPSDAARIPSAPIDLGDWRNSDEATTLTAFQQGVAARYSAGLAIDTVAADLRRNEFDCGPAPPPDAGRGDPPARVCRRTVTNNGCTHTWQVHLFDESNSGQLARTRGLYDRSCGRDGLLGGPG